MLKTKEEFAELVEDVKSQKGYRNPIGFGICRVDLGQLNSDKTLQATYPVLNWNENFGSAAVFINALKKSGVKVNFRLNEFVADITPKFINECMKICNPYVKSAIGNAHKNVQVVKMIDSLMKAKQAGTYRVVFLFKDGISKSVESVYMKLYALSLGKAPLRSLNLDGAFGLLTNVAWVDNFPIELDFLRVNEVELKLSGRYPNVSSVDKFPRFLQHIIPADNTRILDTSKVRMGAQLAGGTTVMPGASYINFNAGTEGAVMVEGRISSSAIVKAGADVGGGASILGVLSGTNGNPISIGENTLLGANSVTGIPVGDGCIIDAGISILEGTKVTIEDSQIEEIKKVNSKFIPNGRNIFKGLELAGFNGIHFRQNAESGQIMAFRSKRKVKLNKDLH